jgi:hypothetical protein
MWHSRFLLLKSLQIQLEIHYITVCYQYALVIISDMPVINRNSHAFRDNTNTQTREIDAHRRSQIQGTHAHVL